MLSHADFCRFHAKTPTPSYHPEPIFRADAGAGAGAVALGNVGGAGRHRESQPETDI